MNNGNNSKIILNILLVVIGILIGYLGTNFINNLFSDDKAIKNSSDVKLSGGKITFNDYILTLPDDVLYFSSNDDSDSTLKVINSNDKWIANIKLYDKSLFESGLFDNYDKLSEYLHNDTLRDIKNEQVVNKNGKEIISFEGYGEISSGLFAYVPTYDNYEFEIVLFDGDNKTINYKALDTVIDILVNGEKIK